ncbi:MAG: hypothetical protein WCK38_03710, partial [Candidatus Omnitrophota bacterium]
PLAIFDAPPGTHPSVSTKNTPPLSTQFPIYSELIGYIVLALSALIKLLPNKKATRATWVEP